MWKVAHALLAQDNEANVLLDLAEQLGHVGHWRVTLPDRELKWSAEVYRIHGVSPDNFVPNPDSAYEFFHPDDRDSVRSILGDAGRNGGSFEFAARLYRADGELRHVKARGVAIARPDDAPTLIFGVFMDVTDQRRAEEVLQQANFELGLIAFVDSLTGLANRRQFDTILEREWRRAIRDQTALSLVLLDIDRFKMFNDQYGHLAGDECLRRVASMVAAVPRRPADLVSRYGGEEFALILPVTEMPGALKVAEAVRSGVAAMGLTHAGNLSGNGVITVSVGAATAYPQPDEASQPWLELLAETDKLLYEAKRTGRNRVVWPESLLKSGPAPLPANEAARLVALARYQAGGARRCNVELDRIARLAAKLTDAPIGLVSLVGQDEQRFAGNFGLDGIDGTGRDVSFCAHTILGDDPFVVPDASRDGRFSENALVTGDLGLRYYAGAPIISETTGHHLGAVCVIDRSARSETSQAQRALLTDLAKMAASLLEEQASESVPKAGD